VSVAVAPAAIVCPCGCTEIVSTEGAVGPSHAAAIAKMAASAHPVNPRETSPSDITIGYRHGRA
jgi:hypothetical protein